MSGDKCATCGGIKYPSATLCDGCWEVETRLDGYLAGGSKARAVLLKALAPLQLSGKVHYAAPSDMHDGSHAILLQLRTDAGTLVRIQIPVSGCCYRSADEVCDAARGGTLHVFIGE